MLKRNKAKISRGLTVLILSKMLHGLTV